MDSVKVLEKLLKIIEEDKDMEAMFLNEKNWLRDRGAEWQADKIRIGVIGVTSSGKSTLINAILGTEVLSSAAEPSSGQLVCCSYGDENSIKIVFDNKKKDEILTGKKFSKENLSEYSDERMNPHNTKGVQIIELSTPRFDLGKDVLLVDSPGLDAYGLEYHEKLTLESLLPTIDACIYVTTMKPNSDAKTMEILNAIARHNCPVIVVQNMLDAVMPSPGGDKTKEQVAFDHMTRLMRIINKSDITDKSSVRVIQMSAQNAKKRRCGLENVPDREFQESYYNEFVKTVKAVLDEQRPHIENQRLRSVKSYIDGMADVLKVQCGLKPAAVKTKVDFEKLKAEVSGFEAKLEKEIEKTEANYVKACKNIYKKLTGKSSSDTSNRLAPVREMLLSRLKGAGGRVSVSECLSEANDAMAAFGSDLEKIMKQGNDFVTQTAQTLGMPPRDLMSSVTLSKMSEIREEKKVEEYTVWVDNDDFGIIRAIGDFVGKHKWGRHEETRTRTVINEDATAKAIGGTLSTAGERYSATAERWFKNITKSFAKVHGRLDMEIKAEKERVKIVLQAEKSAKLLKELEKLNSSLAVDNVLGRTGGSSVAVNAQRKTKKIKVESYVGSAVQLAQSGIKSQNRAVFRSFVELKNLGNHNGVIIGWDKLSIDAFLWQTGLKNASVFCMDDKTDIKLPKGKNCIFVMVNAVQVGAATKQIKALNLEKSVKKDDCIVWVVQDFGEVIMSDGVQEAIKKTADISDVVNAPCDSLLYLVHKNPLYNIALCNIAMNQKSTLADEVAFVNELQKEYPMYLDVNTEKTIKEILKLNL